MDHYVEDEVGNFRLSYSVAKFRWAIMSPGWIRDLHVLVRNSKNKKIMATICGVPKKFIVFGRNLKMNEVNFLAVHKKLRSKRFAQIMI
jgi:glycylpeptide N-tetradecanoyltransferase